MSTEKKLDNRVIFGVSLMALVVACLCVFLCICLIAGLGAYLGISELPVYMDPTYY